MKCYEEYIHAWDRRFEEKRAREAHLKDQARKIAQNLAKMLYEEFGAKRVYLIGSLVHNGPFRDKSDIDLVVEALPNHLFFKAWSKIENFSSFKVDLIPYEDAKERIKEAVRCDGTILYGK